MKNIFLKTALVGGALLAAAAVPASAQSFGFSVQDGRSGYGGYSGAYSDYGRGYGDGYGYGAYSQPYQSYGYGGYRHHHRDRDDDWRWRRHWRQRWDY